MPGGGVGPSPAAVKEPGPGCAPRGRSGDSAERTDGGMLSSVG